MDRPNGLEGSSDRTVRICCFRPVRWQMLFVCNAKLSSLSCLAIRLSHGLDITLEVWVTPVTVRKFDFVIAPISPFTTKLLPKILLRFVTSQGGDGLLLLDASFFFIG